VRWAGWAEAAEKGVDEFGGGVKWGETEGQLRLLDEGVQLAGVAGQVLVGQLKGEDQEAGGGGVEPAADDSGDHFCEGTLDGNAVGEGGQVEAG
jgi:hypothetical protein